jgi:hypothetical protein
VEVCSLTDIAATADLVAAALRSITPSTVFTFLPA